MDRKIIRNFQGYLNLSELFREDIKLSEVISFLQKIRDSKESYGTWIELSDVDSITDVNSLIEINKCRYETDNEYSTRINNERKELEASLAKRISTKHQMEQEILQIQEKLAKL